MNSTATPAAAARSEVPLTRAAKEELLRHMYSRAHWIELIRLIGYQSVPMDTARQAIKPLAEQYGKEPVASACEVLVEIFTQDKDAFARLKPHVRRMAFQILGPEPVAEATLKPVASAPAEIEPNTKTPQPMKPRKPPKQEMHATARTSPANANPVPVAADNRTTIMEQYHAAKEKHPDMLLLFRMGDFYELFGQDAEIAHKLLGLTLTTRDRTLTMAGFPHHQLETYLHKLLHEGQRVAICEPVEESLARGPIRREVTRVVTPAATTEESQPETTVPVGASSESADAEDRPVRQPRHLVLKRCEDWFKAAELAFVALEDVRRTTPAVAPYVGVLDFIVLRDEEKLLVTVRPHLQAKHISAIRELSELYGPEYKPVRIWPSDGLTGWIWRDYAIDLSVCAPTNATRRPRPKRSRGNTSK
jgi:MutS domain I